jgi:hypothetical protein
LRTIRGRVGVGQKEEASANLRRGFPVKFNCRKFQ